MVGDTPHASVLEVDVSKIHTLLGSISSPQQIDRVKIIATRADYLTPGECDRVIALGELFEQEVGTLGADQTMKQSTRRSNVTYLMHTGDTSWLYEKLGLEIQAVNADAYHYSLTGIEAIQLAVYEEGDHYDWHQDLGVGENSTRKLGMSIQVSDPEDYEGGDLDFFKVPDATTRRLGSVIFFPSFLHHCITPVTRGRRYSLVAWAHGDAFR